MALSAPLLTRKRTVVVGNEGTKGTAVAASQGVLAFDPVISPTAPFADRRGSAGYLGHTTTGVVNELSGEWTGDLELRGDEVDDLDPGLEILMLACGFEKTDSVYTPTSSHTTQKTATIIQQDEGVKKTLSGAMGNVVIEGEIGKRVMCKFSMSGVWNAPTDNAQGAVTPGTADPLKLLGGTFTLGAQSIQISKFSLDMGNEVVMRPDVDAAGGIIYYMITDRDPVLSIDPEADLVAGYDYHGLWLAGTTAAVSLALGTGAGKRITIAIPMLQYREIKPADRNGIQIYDVTGQCVQNTGDDELTITIADS